MKYGVDKYDDYNNKNYTIKIEGRIFRVKKSG